MNFLGLWRTPNPQNPHWTKSQTYSVGRKGGRIKWGEREGETERRRVERERKKERGERTIDLYCAKCKVTNEE